MIFLNRKRGLSRKPLKNDFCDSPFFNFSMFCFGARFLKLGKMHRINGLFLHKRVLALPRKLHVFLVEISVLFIHKPNS